MSALGKVVTGVVKQPHSLLIYGPDGIGKSSFAASAPAPIFIGSERGTANLNVSRYSVTDFNSFKEIMKSLHDEEHAFKTVVLDSLDWLEPIVWDHVCQEKGWKGIEAPGYGKGYVEANKLWKDEVINPCERLREKGMNLIFIAHSHVRTFQDPTTDVGYDRYQLKLNEKAGALFREFVDCVLFTNFETYAKEGKNTTRGKGFGDGGRVVFTERRPAWDAKNRFNLPFKLALSWDEYAQAVDGGASDTPEDLQAQCKDFINAIADDTTKKNAKAKLKEVGLDPVRLRKLKNLLLVNQGEQQ